MKNSIFAILLCCSFCITSCSKNDAQPNGTSGGAATGEWLLPTSEVLNGAGKDAIPALENAVFIPVEEVDFLIDSDLVLAIKVGDEIRAYPHPILDWHEIINDGVGDLKFAVTYCPLTGTGIGWDRMLGGNETTFGVSGLLYNTNLIPYDRASNSNWSQIRLDCVFGDRISEKIETIHLIETTWQSWKEMYPESKVVSTNTGHDRSYGDYPYADYKTSPNLLFPINVDDGRLTNPKERVLGVIGPETTRAYRFSEVDQEEVNVILDELDGDDIVVIGSSERNFMVAYQARLDDNTLLTFTAISEDKDIIAEDNEGNEWNIFGEAVSGPRTGTKLRATTSFIGYWFSWGAFYPGLEIYGQ